MNRYFKNSPTRRKFFRAEGMRRLPAILLPMCLLLIFPLMTGLQQAASLLAQTLPEAARYLHRESRIRFALASEDTLQLSGPVTLIDIAAASGDSVSFAEVLVLDPPVRAYADSVAIRARFKRTRFGRILRLQARPAQYLVSRFWHVRVPQGMNVVIRTQAGDVQLRGLRGSLRCTVAGGSVTVARFEGELECRTVGGGLQVSDSRGRFSLHASGGGLLLDSLAGPVDARTMGGALRAQRLFGEARLQVTGGSLFLVEARAPVSARTTGGALFVQNSTDSLFLFASSGDIRLENILGPVRAHSRGGKIHAKGLASVFELTASGDMRLSDIAAGGRARSSSGEIHAELRCAAATARLSLQTTGGSLFLHLPEACPVSIRARIALPRNRSRRSFSIHSDLPMHLSRREKQDRVILSGSHTPQTPGRWQINLETSAADIRISTSSRRGR